MFNPFYIYSISWIYVLVLYHLPWSYINPPLTIEMYLFIMGTVLIMLVLGRVFKRKATIKWHDISFDSKTIKVTLALMFLHIINILYAGYIPLVEIVLKRGFNYSEEFTGIPFVQTFLFSATSFLIVYLYHMFLSTRKKKIIMLIILNFLPFILVFYRSIIVITLMNCVWLHFFRIKKLGTKGVSVVLILFLIGSYIFGVSGDIRTANQAGVYDSSDSEIIMQIGAATQEFRNSKIPKPYYWVYLYSTSSLANFQSITESYQEQDIGLSSFAEFVNSEIIYSMISERINVLYGKSRVRLALNSPALNVSTVYGSSFYYLGWLGPLLMFQFTLVLLVVYYVLIRKSKEYSLISISILNTLVFMNIFSNMFTWTTLSIQLMFPFVLLMYKTPKFRIN